MRLQVNPETNHGDTIHETIENERLWIRLVQKKFNKRMNVCQIQSESVYYSNRGHGLYRIFNLNVR
jgi:hypothetical protein